MIRGALSAAEAQLARNVEIVVANKLDELCGALHSGTLQVTRRTAGVVPDAVLDWLMRAVTINPRARWKLPPPTPTSIYC